MTYALAVNEFEGIWRVYCNVCRVDMGTMSITSLKWALDFAAKRGGVMCPDCRAARCVKCGTSPSSHALLNGVCGFCLWEADAEEAREMLEKPACLVNQNSRKPRETE